MKAVTKDQFVEWITVDQLHQNWLVLGAAASKRNLLHLRWRTNLVERDPVLEVPRQCQEDVQSGGPGNRMLEVWVGMADRELESSGQKIDAGLEGEEPRWSVILSYTKLNTRSYFERMK